jgi:hypothetical protein
MSGILEHVWNYRDTASKDGPAACQIAASRPRVKPARGVRPFRFHAREGDEVEQFAIERRDSGRAGKAQLHRRRRDGIEHRLNVGGRPADHAQDFARRSLLFQCLCQFLLDRPAVGLRLCSRLPVSGARSGTPPFWSGGLCYLPG